MNVVAKINGVIVSVADLPPSNVRWTAARKRLILFALQGGIVTYEECEKRYGITREELDLWRVRFSEYGKKGLRLTYCQDYRKEKTQ